MKSNLADIVSQAETFIRIPSFSGNTEALSRALETALESLSGFTIERFERNGTPSALIYNSPERPKKFKVILNGHLDVVPGKESGYTPQNSGGKLIGTGSMDMKANVACLISAFKEVAPHINYPLALQLVTDEEVGGFDGTKLQVEQGVRTEFVLAGEPTNYDIVHKAKGVLWLKVTAYGKTAHGAYPWRGQNAVLDLYTFLGTLFKKYPVPKKDQWKTSINVSRIETENLSFNKIPDTATVWLDIRHIPEDSKNLLPIIKKLLPKKWKLEIIANEPALMTEKKDKYLQLLAKITNNVTRKKTIFRGANGSSDARHFSPTKSAGIEFGPIGGNIGADDEWVSIRSLEKYMQILVNFLLAVNSK